MRVTDGNGCENSASQRVTVNPLPVVSITPSGPTTFCAGRERGPDGQPAGASYLWSNGAMTRTITVSASGSYTVSVTDGNGCVNSASQGVTVNPLPVVSITPSGPTTFCAGGSVDLTANPAGASYLWSNGAGDADDHSQRQRELHRERDGRERLREQRQPGRDGESAAGREHHAQRADDLLRGRERGSDG